MRWWRDVFLITLPKLSDLCGYFVVAAGFSLRLLAHNKLIKNSLKLRNLKVAATYPNYVVRAGINRSI